MLCYRLLLSRSCRSRHSSESLHRVTVCFVMALRECGFPRQLHALSVSCVIAVLVAPSAVVGPQTPSLVRILTPSSFSHRTRCRRLAPRHTLTRSKMASQDLFCHKVCFSFFPFHCHIPLLSMLWITGFHRLCS